MYIRAKSKDVSEPFLGRSSGVCGMPPPSSPFLISSRSGRVTGPATRLGNYSSGSAIRAGRSSSKQGSRTIGRFKPWVMLVGMQEVTDPSGMDGSCGDGATHFGCRRPPPTRRGSMAFSASEKPEGTERDGLRDAAATLSHTLRHRFSELPSGSPLGEACQEGWDSPRVVELFQERLEVLSRWHFLHGRVAETCIME